jgi:hypothetical protein
MTRQMPDPIFDELQDALEHDGPSVALEHLCRRLTERKDFHNLFYAILVQKRHTLGVSPIPSGPSSDLPAEKLPAYEEGIREAAREVGRLFLSDGNIPHAWAYFRMIGETDSIKAALATATPSADDDIHPLIDIAYFQGVHPRRGFDWILDRNGMCNAITTLSGADVNLPDDVREHCIQRLVRALYEELSGRLRNAVETKSGVVPPTESVRELLQNHPWLCEDAFPHIDTSHLSAVAQMSLYLPRCPELDLARQLCEYGMRLPPTFQPAGDSPFEDFYRAHAKYLAAIAGSDTVEGVAYFRSRLGDGAQVENTRPAEVVVNLLLRLDRPADAIAVARQHLSAADGQFLTCPSVMELCRRLNDYENLSAVARERDDPVHFLAGLLARHQWTISSGSLATPSVRH